MTLPNKILLVSYMRSGTHVVKNMIEQALELDSPGSIKPFDGNDLDHFNFAFGGSASVLYVTHFEAFEHFSPGYLDRINAIIKNRKIYVIFLDRHDFVDQLLSKIIFMEHMDAEAYKVLTKKVYVKKEWVFNYYRNLYRLKFYNQKRIPLNINQRIFYEDVVDKGFSINGELIAPIDKNNNNDNALIKRPEKHKIIQNYNKVIKWIEEASEIYNESWEPHLKWGKNE